MAMIGAPPRGFGLGISQGFPTEQPSAPAFNLETPSYHLPPTTAPAKPKVNWMGVLADALSGAVDQPGQYAASMRQKQAEQTSFERGEQQYRTHRQDSNDDWMKRQQYEHANPDPSPMMRDATSWLGMSDAQREAYRASQAAKPQFISDGMGGGQWAQPPAPTPGRPAIGAVVSDPRVGGQSQPATGNFPFGNPLDPNLGR